MPPYASKQVEKRRRSFCILSAENSGRWRWSSWAGDTAGLRSPSIERRVSGCHACRYRRPCCGSALRFSSCRFEGLCALDAQVGDWGIFPCRRKATRPGLIAFVQYHSCSRFARARKAQLSFSDSLFKLVGSAIQDSFHTRAGMRQTPCDDLDAD